MQWCGHSTDSSPPSWSVIRKNYDHTFRIPWAAFGCDVMIWCSINVHLFSGIVSYHSVKYPMMRGRLGATKLRTAGTLLYSKSGAGRNWRSLGTWPWQSPCEATNSSQSLSLFITGISTSAYSEIEQQFNNGLAGAQVLPSYFKKYEMETVYSVNISTGISSLSCKITMFHSFRSRSIRLGKCLTELVEDMVVPLLPANSPRILTSHYKT